MCSGYANHTLYHPHIYIFTIYYIPLVKRFLIISYAHHYHCCVAIRQCVAWTASALITHKNPCFSVSRMDALCQGKTKTKKKKSVSRCTKSLPYSSLPSGQNKTNKQTPTINTMDAQSLPPFPCAYLPAFIPSTCFNCRPCSTLLPLQVFDCCGCWCWRVPGMSGMSATKNNLLLMVSPLPCSGVMIGVAPSSYLAGVIASQEE